MDQMTIEKDTFLEIPLVDTKNKNNYSERYCKIINECSSRRAAINSSEPVFNLPIIEVLFKGNRKERFNNDQNYDLKCCEPVVVQIDNGIDYGFVTHCNYVFNRKDKTIEDTEIPKFKLLRRANNEDVEKYQKNLDEEAVVVERTKDFVRKLNLDMKIIDSEWQFDKQRLTIYFTAPQRIDFRELVKELARAFKTRIELRQISTREETKRHGAGVGCCGLTLCCTSFLSEFSHVTLDHARVQQLSSNVAKLSGNCGRLKCCLVYEYDTYQGEVEKFPPLSSEVTLPEGNARIIKIDIFKGCAYLHIPANSKYLTLTFEQLDDYARKGLVKKPLPSESHRIRDEFFADLDVILDD